jgi:hypothetical protein
MNQTIYGKRKVIENIQSGDSNYFFQILIKFKAKLFWKDHIVKTLGVTDSQAMKIINDNINELPGWIGSSSL